MPKFNQKGGNNVFNQKLMKKINLDEEIRKVPVEYQSIMIHSIERILEDNKDELQQSLSTTDE